MQDLLLGWVRASSWIRSRLGLDGDRGATAVEYGIMVALIAAVIIVAVALIGTQLNAKFCYVLTQLGGACP